MRKFEQDLKPWDLGSDPVQRLGDFVDLIRGTTYQGQLVGKPGPALLGLGAIQPGGGFRDKDFKTYGGECPVKLMLAPGDIFASLKGATKDGEMIGSVARVPPEIPCGRLTQDTVKLVFRKRDPDFENYLYWVLRTPHYRAYCAGRATGSAVVALSREDFLGYPIPPMTSERARFVEALEAIEKRCALLSETNTTFESIARALFKSWFIDFDPVRAKTEGREPEGMDEAMAVLFPSEFQESALGLIPKGWRAGHLGLLCAEGGGLIQTGPFGSQLHASDYAAEGTPVVMPQDIESRRISTERVARVSEAHVKRLERHKLSPGDVVFSRRGDVGRHAAVSDAEAGWLCGTGCLLVRPGPHCPSSSFVSQALATSQATEWLKRHAVGATMPNLNTGILAGLPMLLPLPPVLAAFEQIVGKVDARINANRAQVASLSELRNRLLPRLVSGRLRNAAQWWQFDGAIA